MIQLLGDIHGDTGVLYYAIEKAQYEGATALIQVGDFGLFDYSSDAFRRAVRDAKIPVYFIDGNHDDCERWVQLKEVTRIYDDANLFYIPRGTVMEIDGRTIAFMGGAASIDKAIRLREGWHWTETENISPQEILRLLENAQGKKIDLFITHCPPHSVIQEHFNPMDKLQFGVGIEWTDPNQLVIEELWAKLDYPFIYSGHMHRNVGGMTYRILDINEVLTV